MTKKQFLENYGHIHVTFLEERDALMWFRYENIILVVYAVPYESTPQNTIAIANFDFMPGNIILGGDMNGTYLFDSTYLPYFDKMYKLEVNENE